MATRRPPSALWRSRLWHLFAALLCLLLGFALGQLAQPWIEASERNLDPYARLDTFAQVLNRIEQHYVEAVDHQAIIYGAIKGMVRALDPHSSFLTPDELRVLRERTAGRFVGVGMEIGVRDGQLMVIAPIPGGPAARAGVRAGDIIVRVEDLSTKEASVEEVVNKLRGEEGTNVRVFIQRKGESRPLEFILERRTVKIVAVEHQLLEPGFGLIAVRTFSENIGYEVRRAYDALRTENGDAKLKGIVLDLRNNPGGLLREAVDLANVFMENGLIVTTRGRSGLELASHSASGRKAYIDLPLVVLINRGSASASEIVAGALQDHGRAVLVGTQSFGKGSVQNIYDLSDGSGLKLTIARYYTPKHRSIQGLGISPDIVVEDVQLPSASGDKAPREEDLSHALPSEGPPPDATTSAADATITDLPLLMALNQLKGHHILSGKP